MNTTQKSPNDTFVIMLMGQTGRGKSSTINSLMGANVAPVNTDEPQTMSVEVFDAEANGIKFQIVDTPGLCDALPEEQNDDKYVELIKEKINEIDCLWFVSRLDETRVTSDEKRAIRIISEAFGNDIWNYVVIVFTFAGNVKKQNFAQKLETRGKLIKKEIEVYAGEPVSSEIQALAVDNENPLLPDGNEWLGELYTQTFLKFKEDGAAAFLLATADRVKKNDEGEPGSGIRLNDQQIERIGRHVSKSELTVGAIGAVLGSTVAGPFGAFMGYAYGAVVGRFLNWIFGGN